MPGVLAVLVGKGGRHVLVLESDALVGFKPLCVHLASHLFVVRVVEGPRQGCCVLFEVIFPELFEGVLALPLKFVRHLL